jgi:hypothetical protein
LFRKRIGVVVVEDDLGEHAHKKLFSHKKKIVVVIVEDNVGEHAKKNSFYTRKNFRSSTETRVRSRLSYPENATFPSIYDLLRSYRAHNKEHR